MKKRALGIFLCLLMVVQLFPAMTLGASAADLKPISAAEFEMSGYELEKTVGDVKVTGPSMEGSPEFYWSYGGISKNSDSLDGLFGNLYAETDKLKLATDYFLFIGISAADGYTVSNIAAETFTLKGIGKASNVFFVDGSEAVYLSFKLPQFELGKITFGFSGYEFGKTPSDISVTGPSQDYGYIWSFGAISKSNDDFDSVSKNALTASDTFEVFTTYYLCIQLVPNGSHTLSDVSPDSFILNGVGKACSLYTVYDGAAGYLVFELPQFDLPEKMNITIDGYRTGRNVGDVKVTVPDIKFSEKYHVSFVPVGLSTSMDSIEAFEAGLEKDDSAALRYKVNYYLGVAVMADPGKNYDFARLTTDRFVLEGYGNPAKISFIDYNNIRAFYIFFELPQLDYYDISFSLSGYERGNVIQHVKIDSPNGDKIKYANNIGGIFEGAYGLLYGITTNIDSPESMINDKYICGGSETETFIAGKTYYLYIRFLPQDGYALSDYNWNNITLDGVGIAEKIFTGKTDAEGAVVCFTLPTLTADPISFDMEGYELGTVARNVNVTTNDAKGVDWNNGYLKQYTISTDITDEISLLNSAVGFEPGIGFTDEVLNATATYYLVVALRKDTGFAIDGLSEDLITLNGVGKACRLIRYTDENNSDNDCVYACFRLPRLGERKTINFDMTGYELDAFVKNINVTTEDAADGIDWNNSFLDKYFIVTDITDFESIASSLCGVDPSFSGETSDERFEKNKKYYLCLALEKETGFSFYGLKKEDIVLNGFGQACKIIEHINESYNKIFVCFDLPELFKTYSVSFNANGGNGTMESVTAKEGAYTLPDCAFTAPKGKQFKGWATSENGSVISGDSFELLADTVLYAIWETHPHTWGKWTAVDAKNHTRSCSCGETETALHTPGAPATETEAQLCTDCGYVLAPATGHIHAFTKQVADSKYLKSAATCTEKAVYYYSCRCGEAGTATFEYGTANGHNEVTDKAIAATCTKDGLTEGKHCSVCNTVFVKQEVIKAKGHTEVTDKAVAPTCTENGLTEGKHCSVCNTVLVKQEVIKAKGHNYQDGYCTDCGSNQQEDAQKNCTHLCHKSGFSGFVWKIVRFFCMIFKINPVCSCKAKHY